MEKTEYHSSCLTRLVSNRANDLDHIAIVAGSGIDLETLTLQSWKSRFAMLKRMAYNDQLLTNLEVLIQTFFASNRNRLFAVLSPYPNIFESSAL